MEPDSPHTAFRSAHWAAKEVDLLFSRFRRYTQFVLFSKWFLGVFAIALLASLIAWPLLSKDSSGIRISFTDVGVANNGNVASPVMNNPEFRGSGEHGQQYKISGTKATQVTPSLVVLEPVEAQLLQQSGSWMSLTANRADYHQDSKMIELSGAVNVINNQGYSFITEHAFVDADSMDMHGEVPVSGTGPFGNLLASGFVITDDGQHIVFTNGGGSQVRVQIDRKNKR